MYEEGIVRITTPLAGQHTQTRRPTAFRICRDCDMEMFSFCSFFHFYLLAEMMLRLRRLHKYQHTNGRIRSKYYFSFGFTFDSSRLRAGVAEGAAGAGGSIADLIVVSAIAVRM